MVLCAYYCPERALSLRGETLYKMERVIMYIWYQMIHMQLKHTQNIYYELIRVLISTLVIICALYS